MTPTWERLELPVLRTVAEIEGPGGTDVDEIAQTSGLDREDVRLVAARLWREGYLHGEDTGTMDVVGPEVGFIRLAERGLRAAGVWPPDDALAALVAALEETADRVEDDEQATLLRRVASGFGGAARDVGIQLVGELAAKGFTGL